MKKGRKMLMAVACCILVISLSTMAFATMSKNFFVTKVGGKMVTGSGSLSTVCATATIRAKMIPGEPQQMDEAYSSYVEVAAYDKWDRVVGRSGKKGNVYSFAEIDYVSDAVRYEYTYRFGDTELGTYPVDASLAKP